jgi:hypothetical protein
VKVWDEYAGWIEVSCPVHGLEWAWDAGTPFCPVCLYVPEGANPADNTLDNPSPDGR